MKSNTNSLAENKVLILYVLNKLNKNITNDGLYKIVSSINNLNYFYFQQTLKDLIDTNLVGYTNEENTILKITSEGKVAFSYTQDLLPGIIKLKADTIFEDELATIEEESSVSAEFIPKNEDEYTVKCKIIENNESIFEVETFAGSRDRAKKICDNWRANATKIYPQIINLLLDEKNTNE